MTCSLKTEVSILIDGIIDTLLKSAPYEKTELTPEELKKYKGQLLDKGTAYGKWFSQIERLPNFQGPREYLAQEILLGGDYDIAGAMKAGVAPTPYRHDIFEDGEQAYHWPSKTSDGKWLKDPRSHASAWMEVFQEVTGKDPNEMGIKDKYDAEQYLQKNRNKIPALKKLFKEGGATHE